MGWAFKDHRIWRENAELEARSGGVHENQAAA